MELLLPHPDEFVLDFDAEEALMPAQVLTAGQAQALGVPARPKLVTSSRQNSNAVPKTRVRQAQLGGNSISTEAGQLDSQLDALRREIARLEQQKGRQVVTKVAPGRPALHGSAAAHAAQKGTSLGLSPSRTGSTYDNGAALQSAVAPQGQLGTQRARLSTRIVPMEAVASTGLEGRSNVAAVKERSALTTSAQLSKQVVLAKSGGPPQQPVGSKRPSSEVTGGLTLQQPQLQPKRHQVPQKPSQPSSSHQLLGVGLVAAGSSQSVPEGRREQLQKPATPPGSQEGSHKSAGSSDQSNAAKCVTELQRQGTDGDTVPVTQLVPSQAGPGPPRKRPRVGAQCTTALSNIPAASASPLSKNAGTAGATGTGAQPVIAVNGGMDGRPLNSSPTTAPDERLAAQSKRVRSEVRGPDAPLGLSDIGSDVGLQSPMSAMRPGTLRRHVQHKHGNTDLLESDITDICPEAEQAATEFLISFMTQIGGERHDGNHVAAAALASQPRTDSSHNQGGSQRHLKFLGIRPEDRMATATGADLRSPRVAGAACTEGGCERNAPASGSGGGASARRAAAERTSAAVQRLRRKSSGVGAVEPFPGVMTSLGPSSLLVPVNGTPTADADVSANHRAVELSATSPAFVARVPGGAASLHSATRCNLDRDAIAPALPITAALQPVGIQCEQSASPSRIVHHRMAVELLESATNRPHLESSPSRVVAGASQTGRPSVPGSALAAAVAESHEPAGAVSSPVAPPQQESRVHGVTQHLGRAMTLTGFTALHGAQLPSSLCPPDLQAAASAHIPPWAQMNLVGSCVLEDGGRLGTAPESPTREGQQQQQQHLDKPQQQPQPADRSQGVLQDCGAQVNLIGASAEDGIPNLGSGRTAMAVASATSHMTVDPLVMASAAVPRPLLVHPPLGSQTFPFRRGAPPGPLHPTAAIQSPLMQPVPGTHPPRLAGYPPAMPSGPQWLTPQLAGHPLGARQPTVSLVELDVLARKELILLKWHMLQELAAELEVEWVEACHAHNRLRLLSMAHVESASFENGHGLQLAGSQPPQGTHLTRHVQHGASSLSTNLPGQLPQQPQSSSGQEAREVSPPPTTRQTDDLRPVGRPDVHLSSNQHVGSSDGQRQEQRRQVDQADVPVRVLASVPVAELRPGLVAEPGLEGCTVPAAARHLPLSVPGNTSAIPSKTLSAVQCQELVPVAEEACRRPEGTETRGPVIPAPVYRELVPAACRSQWQSTAAGLESADRGVPLQSGTAAALVDGHQYEPGAVSVNYNIAGTVDEAVTDLIQLGRRVPVVYTGLPTEQGPATRAAGRVVAREGEEEASVRQTNQASQQYSTDGAGSGEGGINAEPYGSGVADALTQVRTSIWMPSKDASIVTAGQGRELGVADVGSRGISSTDRDIIAMASNSSGGAGVASGRLEAGAGQSGAGVEYCDRVDPTTEATAPFSGLSFKLTTAPLSGRRVAAMRSKAGAVSQTGAIVVAGRKCASPSVSVVVPAPLVQPRGRPPAIIAGPSNGATASAAPVASVPPHTVIAAPVKHSVHVQSASQVQSALRGRNGNAEAAVKAAQAQQALPQATNIIINGSAGIRDLALLTTQTAQHIKAPHAAAPGSAALRDESVSSHVSTQIPTDHTSQDLRQMPNSDCPSAQQRSPQQRQQQHQEQVRVLLQLASPLSLPRYQARRDIILRKAEGAVAASILGFLTAKYTSPLRIFRSYSGSIQR